jgi:putative nucleotidyltransferase with HDIG domain
MKKVAFANLQPGMIVAEAIHSLNGKQILFPKGVTLTNKTIHNIKNWDIPYVMIVDDVSSPLEETIEKTEDRSSSPSSLPPLLVKKSHDFGNTLYDSIEKVNDLFDHTRRKKSVDIKEFNEVALQIFEHLIHPSEAVHRLLFSLAKKNSLAYHSVMVASLSGMLANWMDWDCKEIKEIILAGLLHDVGKTQLPVEVIEDRDSAFMNPETIQTHVLLAFKLLKGMRALSPNVLTAIVQHHEYLDGSGYPQQLSGDKIHIFSRVISVVNYLSTMIAEAKSINPFMLLQSIKTEMFIKLDPEVCDVFTRRISDYLLNCLVVLEDGRQAKVVFLPNVNPILPVLQVDDEFIDMLKDKDVKIVGLLM